MPSGVLLRLLKGAPSINAVATAEEGLEMQNWTWEMNTDGHSEFPF